MALPQSIYMDTESVASRQRALEEEIEVAAQKLREVEEHWRTLTNVSEAAGGGFGEGEAEGEAELAPTKRERKGQQRRSTIMLQSPAADVRPFVLKRAPGTQARRPGGPYRSRAFDEVRAFLSFALYSGSRNPDTATTWQHDEEAAATSNPRFVASPHSISGREERRATFVVITDGRAVGVGSAGCVDLWSAGLSGGGVGRLQELLPFLAHAPPGTLLRAASTQLENLAPVIDRASWTTAPQLYEYLQLSAEDAAERAKKAAERTTTASSSSNGEDFLRRPPLLSEIVIVDKDFTKEVKAAVDGLRRRQATLRQATIQFQKAYSSYVTKRQPEAQRQNYKSRRGKEGLNPNSEEYQKFKAIWLQSGSSGITGAPPPPPLTSSTMPSIIERSVLEEQVTASQFVILRRIDPNASSSVLPRLRANSAALDATLLRWQGELQEQRRGLAEMRAAKRRRYSTKTQDKELQALVGLERSAAALQKELAHMKLTLRKLEKQVDDNEQGDIIVFLRCDGDKQSWVKILGGLRGPRRVELALNVTQELRTSLMPRRDVVLKLASSSSSGMQREGVRQERLIAKARGDAAREGAARRAGAARGLLDADAQRQHRDWAPYDEQLEPNLKRLGILEETTGEERAAAVTRALGSLASLAQALTEYYRLALGRQRTTGGDGGGEERQRQPVLSQEAALARTNRLLHRATRQLGVFQVHHVSSEAAEQQMQKLSRDDASNLRDEREREIRMRLTRALLELMHEGQELTPTARMENLEAPNGQRALLALLQHARVAIAAPRRKEATATTTATTLLLHLDAAANASR